MTWFRYGPVNLVRLRFADGSESSLIAQPLTSAVAAAGRPADDRHARIVREYLESLFSGLPD